MITFIIALCIVVPWCVAAYCFGYSAGIEAGIRSTGLGTRIDATAPICGRKLRPLTENELNEN